MRREGGRTGGVDESKGTIRSRRRAANKGDVEARAYTDFPGPSRPTREHLPQSARGSGESGRGAMENHARGKSMVRIALRRVHSA